MHLFVQLIALLGNYLRIPEDIWRKLLNLAPFRKGKYPEDSTNKNVSFRYDFSQR